MTDDEILAKAAQIRVMRQREHEEAVRLRYQEAEQHGRERLRRDITAVLDLFYITDKQLSEIISYVSDYMG